jgi:hypothetical protein
MAHALTRATLCSIALVALGCGPTVAAATVFDSAHEMANQAEAAHADLASCSSSDAGALACDRTNKDLWDLLGTANNLEGAAQDAGYAPPTPPSPLPKFCKPVSAQ